MSFREIDQQTIQDDARIQRLLKMKIIEMETKENAPKWREQQMLRFPQAIPISDVPTLGQIISEEKAESATNEEMLYQRAELKLNTIAPKTSVEFILDRLSRQDLYYLNNSWDGLLKKLREEYSTKGLDKMAFVGIIKSSSSQFFDVDDFEKEDIIGLTDRGENRKKNIQQQIDELQKKIDEQNEQQQQDIEVFEEKVSRAQNERIKAQNERIKKKKDDKKQYYDANIEKLKSLSEDPKKVYYDKNIEKLKKWSKTVTKQPEGVEESKNMDDVAVQTPTKGSFLDETPEKGTPSKRTGRPPAYSLLSPDNYKLYEFESNQENVLNMTENKRKRHLSSFASELLKAQRKQERIKEKEAFIGMGLKTKKRRVVIGGGGETPIEARKRKNAVNKKVINGKYVDLTKLNSNNILTVRYCSTGAVVPTMKTQKISKDVKDILDDIFSDKFEKRIYEKLNNEDKKVVKRFASSVNLDIDLHTIDDDEYNKQYNIILGEFVAGNTSPEVVQKLKQYVTDSFQNNYLPRREAYNLLFQLANV